jgi:hypothetical protein
MFVEDRNYRIKTGHRERLIQLRTFFLICGLLVILHPLQELAQQQSNVAGKTSEQTPSGRDGQHDFDFEIGLWKTHLWRLLHPLTGSNNWVEYEGTTVCRKVWNGRANLLELVADGPPGHFEGLNLRLYNPGSRQWSLNFANSRSGTLSPPTIGEFKNGRGEFYSQETLNGRAILVRFVISDIKADSCRFEQAFSDDGGKTWEVNWIAIDTRVKGEANKASALRAPPQADSSHAKAEPQTFGAARNGQRDFDFNIGTWKTKVSRLLHSLAGSTTWAEYNGTSVVREVWNGRANLFELEVDGSADHIEGMGLRLYNPESHQWSLNWANSHDGTMTKPMIGEFKNGRGDFFDQESFNGRAIFAHNSFSDITPNSSRFEQAFSNDWGKTWETNWVMTFTRVKDESDKAY